MSSRFPVLACVLALSAVCVGASVGVGAPASAVGYSPAELFSQAVTDELNEFVGQAAGQPITVVDYDGVTTYYDEARQSRSVVKRGGVKVTTICRAPDGNGQHQCFQRRGKGRWVPRKFSAVDGQSSPEHYMKVALEQGLKPFEANDAEKFSGDEGTPILHSVFIEPGQDLMEASLSAPASEGVLGLYWNMVQGSTSDEMVLAQMQVVAPQAPIIFPR